MPRSAWVIAMSIRSSGATKDSWPPIGQWPAEFLIEPDAKIPTPTFMKILLSFSRVGWDHKPRDWSAGLHPDAIANRRGSSVPGRRPALRFMERLHSLSRIHWHHEPGRAQRRAGVPPARRARQRERFRSVGVADGGRRDACPTLRFMESLFVAIALMTMPLAGLAEKKPGEAASIEKVEIQGDAKPGGNIVAVVHVKLEKNWHVQSNKPSDPNYIPTVLMLSPRPGVKPKTIKYPQGTSEKVQGLAKPLSVYDGDFQISVPLTLDGNAKLPLTIPATLSYQACQGASCYPPKKLKLEIVVGAETKLK